MRNCARDQSLARLSRRLRQRRRCDERHLRPVFGMSRSGFSRSSIGRHRVRRRDLRRRPRPPKFPPSPRASARKRRPSPTARSSKGSSRPPSAPNIIWPAGSTASGNTTCRCGCSPTATAPDRKAQLAKVVADIGQRVQHLDIAMTETSDAANVMVKLVRDRDLYRTITTFYGSERAREIRTSLDPQCLSGFRKNDKLRNRALRRDPHRRQRRFHLPRLRL